MAADPLRVPSVLLLLALAALAAMPAAAQLRVATDRGWPILAWRGQALTRALPDPAVSVNVAG